MNHPGIQKTRHPAARQRVDLTSAGGASLTRMMHSLLSDLRYAARELRRRRGSTLTAVISLALGVGATSAVFSVIHAVLINPFPYVGAERITTLKTALVAPDRKSTRLNSSHSSISYAVF